MQAGAAHNPAPARGKKAEPADGPENGNCGVGLGRGKGSVGTTNCEGGAGVPVGELAAELAPRRRCREHCAVLGVPRW